MEHESIWQNQFLFRKVTEEKHIKPTEPLLQKKTFEEGDEKDPKMSRPNPKVAKIQQAKKFSEDSVDLNPSAESSEENKRVRVRNESDIARQVMFANRL